MSDRVDYRRAIEAALAELADDAGFGEGRRHSYVAFVGPNGARIRVTLHRIAGNTRHDLKWIVAKKVGEIRRLLDSNDRSAAPKEREMEDTALTRYREVALEPPADAPLPDEITKGRIALYRTKVPRLAIEIPPDAARVLGPDRCKFKAVRDGPRCWTLTPGTSGRAIVHGGRLGIVGPECLEGLPAFGSMECDVLYGEGQVVVSVPEDVALRPVKPIVTPSRARARSQPPQQPPPQQPPPQPQPPPFIRPSSADDVRRCLDLLREIEASTPWKLERLDLTDGGHRWRFVAEVA